MPHALHGIRGSRWCPLQEGWGACQLGGGFFAPSDAWILNRLAVRSSGLFLRVCLDGMLMFLDLMQMPYDAFLWLETAVVNACHQDFSLLDVDFAGPGCIVAILSRVTSPIHTYSCKGGAKSAIWTEWHGIVKECSEIMLGPWHHRSNLAWFAMMTVVGSADRAQSAMKLPSCSVAIDDKCPVCRCSW